MKSSKSRQLKGPTRKKIFTSLAIVLVVLTSFFGGFFTQVALRGETEAIVSDIFHIIDQVGYVYDREKDEYVKIDSNDISSVIATSFLDDYSEVYSEQEYKAMKEQKNGNYAGFGFNFLTEHVNSSLEGTNVIHSVTCNSPAWNQGLRDGDKVVKVEYKSEETEITNGEQLAEILEQTVLNDEITFTVERAGALLEPVTVKKQNYTRCYVTYQDSQKSMYFNPSYGERFNSEGDALAKISEKDEGNSSLTDDVAIIKLYSFNGDAAEEFGAAIKYMLDERERTKLIIDLCDNGGGNMEVLKRICEYLLEDDDAVCAVTTEKLDWEKYNDADNKNYATENVFMGKSKFDDRIEKISIIANRNTASASECLITAADNWKYGIKTSVYSKGNLVIVGSQNNNSSDDIPDNEIEYRTYGKGVMQTTYELTSGGALKITTAKLLNPTQETTIHKKGVVASNHDKNRALDYLDAVSKAVAILNEQPA